MSNPLYQIDLTPSFEDGKYVVREELMVDEDNWDLCEEYKFNTEKEANAFIDSWISKHSTK